MLMTWREYAAKSGMSSDEVRKVGRLLSEQFEKVGMEFSTHTSYTQSEWALISNAAVAKWQQLVQDTFDSWA